MQELKYEWKFLKTEQDGLEKLNVEDSNWRTVRVPHDYAIEGPFAIDNDAQIVGVIADGLVNPINHVGRTGSLPINDKAWYRKKIIIDKATERAFLEFDGVMSNSQIYLNGDYVGGRPFGYTSFCLEITKYMKKGENLLAVRCCPEPCASRWYPGAGIYRNVRLRQTTKVCFDYQSIQIKYKILKNKIDINNSIKILNENNCNVDILTEIYDKNVLINSIKSNTTKGNIEQSLTVPQYKLWSIENPYLYTFKISILQNNKIIDTKVIQFGFREIKFDNNEGFYLNNHHVKIKGVCMHHDLGALGSAVNVYALERQLKILKSFGTNAIRTSHNPCTPELLDLCDKMGFLVMDEAFDEWENTKVINGYAKYFKEWAQKDLEDLVKRDVNHPSVIIWSIGNEILEQGMKRGEEIASRLADIVRSIDTTRAVACGFNGPDGALKNKLDNKLDIIGLNYQPTRYNYFKKLRKDKILLGSETSSCISSRGHYPLKSKYEFPVKIKKDLLINSFDLCGPGWACTPDKEFYYQDKFTFMIGEFVWTGFDYIGEPTPYYNNWPCRSSYFGIVDLAGMPKDRYYNYKSKWKEDEDTIHLFPHWNWNKGQKIDVCCYCSDEKVELFLNGKSLGAKKKKRKIGLSNRIVWKNVRFEEGTLEVVSCINKNLTAKRVTTSAPYALRLITENVNIKADGDSLAYIRCDVVDKDGNICPTANNRVEISVNGVGEYLASDNGKQCDNRTFSEPYCEAFNGSFMIITRSLKNKIGEFCIKVESTSLQSDKTIIKVNKE